MSDTQSFTHEEQKIRKRWLFWVVEWPLILITFVFLLVVLLASAFDALPVSAIGNLFSPLVKNSYVFVFLYLIYYCAYKKHGTMLLIFCLFCLVFELIASVYITFIRSTPNIPSLIGFQISLCWSAWIFYLCLALRLVNKNFKQRVMEGSTEYKEAMSSFQSANNVDELNDKFKALAESLTSGYNRTYVSHAYKLKKNTF